MLALDSQTEIFPGKLETGVCSVFCPLHGRAKRTRARIRYPTAVLHTFFFNRILFIYLLLFSCEIIYFVLMEISVFPFPSFCCQERMAVEKGKMINLSCILTVYIFLASFVDGKVKLRKLNSIWQARDEFKLVKDFKTFCKISAGKSYKVLINLED